MGLLSGIKKNVFSRFVETGAPTLKRSITDLIWRTRKNSITNPEEVEEGLEEVIQKHESDRSYSFSTQEAAALTVYAFTLKTVNRIKKKSYKSKTGFKTDIDRKDMKITLAMLEAALKVANKYDLRSLPGKHRPSIILRGMGRLQDNWIDSRVIEKGDRRSLKRLAARYERSSGKEKEELKEEIDQEIEEQLFELLHEASKYEKSYRKAIKAQ